jgi:hypothetical protein
MAEVQSAIDVATSERDLLLKQQQEAKDRLAGAQEALAAAKRVAAEKEAEIQQISSDMEGQRCALQWLSMASMVGPCSILYCIHGWCSPPCYGLFPPQFWAETTLTPSTRSVKLGQLCLCILHCCVQASS